MLLCVNSKKNYCPVRQHFQHFGLYCDTWYHFVITLKNVMIWRRHPDSNRGSEFCRLVPYHLAISPFIIYICSNYNFNSIFLLDKKGISPGQSLEQRRNTYPRFARTAQSSLTLLYTEKSFKVLKYQEKSRFFLYNKNGAGNGAQTRDLCLGKAALYQLSYSRINKYNSKLFVFGTVLKMDN